MRYESFALRIEPGSGSSYAVSVQSPQGEGRGTFEIPWIGGPLREGTESDRAGALRHLVLSFSAPETQTLDAGKELFRALFKGEVASLFHASLGSLRGRNQGLRISLAVDPRCPELAPLQKLPWELLCRPETEDFLCLSRRTPIVRTLEAHRERRLAIARPGRLRILAVAANPMDRPALAVDRERKNLEKAWKGQERNVEIVFLERGGLEALRRTLLTSPFHILHFMGHGEFDEEGSQGLLLFEQDDGTSQIFEGRHLAQLLRDFESLRLVVLNACHTAEAVGTYGPNPFAGAASSLVMGGVPAVVAMSGGVSDRAAVAFSSVLYQRLASGDPIEAAVTEGRLAIQRAEPEEGAWATPTLFLRSPDGRLFASRSTTWARRVALLAGIAVALALIASLAAGWFREHRAAQAIQLTDNGVALLQLGRREEAREAFLAALEIDPNNANTLGNLAIVEMQSGRGEEALAHARAAVQTAPEEAVHHYNLGRLLMIQKRHEDALASLLQAIEIDPRYVNAYNELGNVYLELDLPTDARKAFEKGLEYGPKLAKLHKNLARAALAEGRPGEAIRHLERALALYSPTEPSGLAEAHYWLASANAAAGNSTEACSALQRFTIFDPHLLSPFANNARLLAGQQRCTSWPSGD